MRRLNIILLSGILAVGLVACGGGSDQTSPQTPDSSGVDRNPDSGGGDNGSGGGNGGGGDNGDPNNVAPTAADDTFTFNMNSPRNRLAVRENDSDPEDDDLTITSFTQPTSGGRLRFDDTLDRLVYQPPINFTGDDSFTYELEDTEGNTDSATVDITLNPHIQPPVGQRPCITEQAQRIAEGRPYCFDAQFPTGFDDHTISATVYVPEMGAGEKRPVLLHAHGFGEARFATLENGTFVMLNRVTAQSLLELWHEGYFVVTYDQRGFNANILFGAATPASNDPCVPMAADYGCIDVMNPEREGRDMTVVVDWIVRNLREGFDPDAPNNSAAADATPLYLEDEPGDPVLGTTGLSYGGGFQTIGSAVDKVLNGDTRVNAMVPVTTWFDFRFSLTPNGVAKTAWLEFLTAATLLGGTPPLSQFLLEAAVDALVTDRVSQGVSDGLYQRSLRSYCENMGTEIADADVVAQPGTASAPGPDVFIIQGQRDTLFNFNEALDMALCYRAANSNADVRLLLETEGHVLALAQPPSYAGPDALIYIDEQVECGAGSLSTREMISGFFREKLGTVPNPGTPINADAVPAVCITDYNPMAAPENGVSYDSLDDVLIGGTVVTLDGDPAAAGDQPVTFGVGPGVDITNPMPATTVTLFTATGDTRMTGIPLLDVDITATTSTNAIADVISNSTPEQLQPLADGLSLTLGALELLPIGQLLGLLANLPGDALAPITDLLLDPPRFFVGIGVQRSGGDFELIFDQVLPISGPRPTLSNLSVNYSYPRTDELGVEHGEGVGRIIGISDTLSAGDEVQLVIYSQHPLFNLNGTLTGLYEIEMTGTASLPLAGI